MAAQASQADVVVNASGVGYGDAPLLDQVMAAAAPHALRVFWDVDASATLAEITAAPGHPLRRALPRLDLVLTYGGGDAVVSAYRRLGAPDCVPIYNALDPDTHHPVAPHARFAADLAFLGNRLPDRRFLLGGSGWSDKALPENVDHLGHVGTADHNTFNCSPTAVLNISRDSMASTGFSPATRVFEAAGACLITDHWEGIYAFLEPGREILVAHDGAEVADLLQDLTPERAQAVGAAARERVLAQHCYSHRARQTDALFARAAVEKSEATA